ncbi:hypothetical protein B0H17DRAFT_902554, partial [Mycena rosella]
ISILAHIEPAWYNCCLNSCAVYTGSFSDLSECLYCDEAHLSPTDKSRRMFGYLPIIPCLQGFFQDPESIQQLLY